MTYNFNTEYLADVEITRESPFLIEGLIHETLTMIYGRPEAGKSFLALSAAMALASGRDWLGRPVEQRKTMFWVMDAGQKEETKRRWMKVGTDRDLLISDTRPSDDDEWWDSWTLHLLELDVEVLFVDNLNKLMGARSVNDDTHARYVMARLADIVDAGIAVVIIHHEAKKLGPEGEGGKSPIGSTFIEAEARHFLQISKDQITPDLRVVWAYGNNAPDTELGILIDPEREGRHGAFVTIGGEEKKSVTEGWTGDPEELAQRLWEQRQKRREKQGRTTEQKAAKAKQKRTVDRPGALLLLANENPGKSATQLWNLLPTKDVAKGNYASSKAALAALVKDGKLKEASNGSQVGYFPAA